MKIHNILIAVLEDVGEVRIQRMICQKKTRFEQLNSLFCCRLYAHLLSCFLAWCNITTAEAVYEQDIEQIETFVEHRETFVQRDL